MHIDEYGTHRPCAGGVFARSPAKNNLRFAALVIDICKKRGHKKQARLDLQTTNKKGSTYMHEIICPHCSKAFKIDEAGYADILKQVRDGAFEQQLHERLELAEQDKRNAVELAQAQVASAMQKSAVAKDSEIQALKARLDAAEVARKLAVTEALSAVQKERDALANELEQAKRLTSLVLAKAFRGELVPQKPTDEPASALLARIRSANTVATGENMRKVPVALKVRAQAAINL
jgi:energy-converting hydrogenase A subunit M